MKRTLAASIIALASWSVAPTVMAQVQPDPFTRVALPETALDDVPLEDAIQFVSRQSGLPIVADWAVLEFAGVTRESPVNVKLRGASVRTFLRFMLRSIPKDEPLAIFVDEGIVRITTKAEEEATLVLRVYDIRDLLVEVPNFTIADINIGGGGGGGGNGGGGGGFGGGGGGFGGGG
ncbi:MAG: hypothetical protein AAGI46_15660, partial [Planctomycetota bacterium]